MMPNTIFAKYTKRLLLVLVLLIVHYAAVVAPISELFLLYILFFKPKWFEDF